MLQHTKNSITILMEEMIIRIIEEICEEIFGEEQIDCKAEDQIINQMLNVIL